MTFIDTSSFGRPLWGDVLDELRQRIVSGALAPGQRLVEQDIATEFAISRGPVRSAIAHLHRRGLVTVSPRRGAEVVAFRRSDVIELFELREALEVLALNGADRIEESVIVHLRSVVARGVEAHRTQHFRTSVDANLDFHRELCRFSGNRRLIEAWETQAEQIRVLTYAAQRVDPVRVRPVMHTHETILQALSDGDIDLAKESLARHLRSSRELLLGPSDGD